MAQYEIKFNRYDGWSERDAEIPVESAFVELSDDEVQILVDIMTKEGTHNVAILNLEELHPGIYEKLSETCDSVAWRVALAEAIRETHFYDEEGVFLDKLQKYCEMEYDYDESLGDFSHWLAGYIQSWSCDELEALYDSAEIDLFWDIISYDGIEPYKYDVIIPQSIVEKVFGE